MHLSTKILVIIALVTAVDCTCKWQGKTCEDGTRMVHCHPDPCDVTTCPGDPDATCVSDNCGGCHANFYIREGVTACCEDCCGGYAHPCDTGLPFALPDMCFCQAGLLCYPNLHLNDVSRGVCMTQEEVDALGGMPQIRG
ncbi:uncharacterized protein LOC144905154 [Branchiostoma floridae x Branchiostoma belcheri]